MSTNKPPLVGIDLVEPERLKVRLDSTPSLRETIFRPGEIMYCDSRPDPIQHLACRFCAKEAVMKALGLAAFDPLEIEVVGGGDEATQILLHGEAAQRAVALGVEVTVSMSHLVGVAAAVALALPVSTRDL
jgi:holo-[acyl-carrier protein] synthase